MTSVSEFQVGATVEVVEDTKINGWGIMRKGTRGVVNSIEADGLLGVTMDDNRPNKHPATLKYTRVGTWLNASELRVVR